MDRSTFLEALKGQPIEEALAADHNADRSYNGYRMISRRRGLLDASLHNNSSGNSTNSSHAGASDEKKNMDMRGNNILQTSATQPSVHISYDLTSK